MYEAGRQIMSQSAMGLTQEVQDTLKGALNCLSEYGRKEEEDSRLPEQIFQRESGYFRIKISGSS